MTKRSSQLLNPLFIFSLIILLLNDNILKSQFHNWITGKISDLFGIIVFVQFLCVFTPGKFKKIIFLFLLVLLSFENHSGALRL